MQKDARTRIAELRVDGGMTDNALLMQMQADLLDSRVARPANIETTVMGAASAAAIGAGLVTAPLALGELTTWHSTMAGPVRDRLMQQWENAVTRSYNLG